MPTAAAAFIIEQPVLPAHTADCTIPCPLAVSLAPNSHLYLLRVLLEHAWANLPRDHLLLAIALPRSGCWLDHSLIPCDLRQLHCCEKDGRNWGKQGNTERPFWAGVLCNILSTYTLQNTMPAY